MVAGLRSTMRVGWELLEGHGWNGKKKSSKSKSNDDDDGSSMAVGMLMVGVGSISYAGSSLLVGSEGRVRSRPTADPLAHRPTGPPAHRPTGPPTYRPTDPPPPP